MWHTTFTTSPARISFGARSDATYSRVVLLDTERLILRSPALTDADDIVDGIRDLEVSRSLLRAPYPYAREDAIWWINTTLQAPVGEKSQGHDCVLVLKSEQRVIGGIGLYAINWDVCSGCLGFWIARKYWRQGFITEAQSALLRWAFTELGLNRIEAHVFVENVASNALMARFGYRFVGTRKQAERCRATGQVHDVNIYEMLRPDLM